MGRQPDRALLIGASTIRVVSGHLPDTTSGVQNEHTSEQAAASPAPASGVAMEGHRLLLCLATIGWTEREFARRAGRHQTTVVRWIRRGLDDCKIARRLEALAAAHETNRLS